MKKSLLVLSMCVLLGAWSGVAGAASVTFGVLPASPFSEHAEAGVVFSALNGGQLQAVTTAAGSQGITSTLVGLDPEFFPFMQAVIVDEAGCVSIDLGDVNNDAETLFIDAYDASDNLLTSTTFLSPIEDENMHTLKVFAPAEGPCVSYVVFGATGGLDGSSVAADNFVYGPCAGPCPGVIPAPGAVLLSMIGTGLVGYLRRRRAF